MTHPRQCPNVVLVSVCDDYCLNLVLPLVQETGVRENLLHTQVLETEGGERGQKGASKQIDLKKE